MCVCVRSVAKTCLTVTTWTVAHQAPLSVGFSRQESWSRLPFPPPRHTLDPGIKPSSLAFPALASRFFTTEPLGKPHGSYKSIFNYCSSL